jgi:predicted GH43/DUF377 family glycosyl hydrolase
MKWRKLGRLWAPDGTLPWARTHAMLPTPLRLSDGRLRLLLASADDNIVSSVGWIDLDGSDPQRILAVAETPVLCPGAPGCFDDNGVNPCTALQMLDGSVRLYYVGYQLQRKIPYTLFSGLAASDTGTSEFRRVSPVPVLDRGPNEIFFRTAPFVRACAEGWQAWYIGGGDFVHEAGRLQPRYSLRHATSADGLIWPSVGRELLAPGPGERGFGRPWVLHGESGWHLWYSIRTAKGYHLGYAESRDGIDWQRQDDRVGIAVSPGEWDGDMICYAAIERIGDRLYMFYNGNGYGRTGVGLAILEQG